MMSSSVQSTEISELQMHISFLLSSAILKSKPSEVSKEVQAISLFQAMREREPPDCWDVEFSDGAGSPKAAAPKTLRGAATFIPKVPCSTTKRQSAECKQVRTCQTPLHTAWDHCRWLHRVV